VVPVRGAKNVSTIVDAPLLSRLVVPLVILFDDVQKSKVESSRRPSGRDVAARAVWDLLHNWAEPRPRPEVVSFELPDIFRALPEDCVRRSVADAGGNFPGWDAVDMAFQQDRARGFKKVVLEQSNLPANTELDRLLSEILEICRLDPNVVLKRAVREVVDSVRGLSPGDGVSAGVF
jgi:hypothetical protein